MQLSYIRYKYLGKVLNTDFIIPKPRVELNAANYSASYEVLGNFPSLSKTQPLNRHNDKRSCITALCMAHNKCLSLLLTPHQLLHIKREHLCSSQFFGLYCQWLGAGLLCLFISSLTLCMRAYTHAHLLNSFRDGSRTQRNTLRTVESIALHFCGEGMR